MALTPDGVGTLRPIEGLAVLHWHGERIVLPAEAEGARILASTPTTPVQAFALPAALGLQFHLEADPARIERWLIGHAHELASNGIDPAAVREGAVVHGERLIPAGRAMLDAWLESVGL